MARRPIRNFDAVLNEALDDIIEHGFDSEERINHWQEQLRRAAEASMMSEREMERMLQEALTAAYRRDVEKMQVLGKHKGVDRFTLDKVRPELRGELSKRIRASANLIKLDRKRMVDETMQRLAGWATSVPAGGSRVQDKKAEKENIRKGLAGIQFRERRVLIDQTHKLNAAISDVIAKGGGAIAANWRSNHRQAGYDYREEHKERESAGPYIIRGSWAHEQGLIKGKFLDSMTQPGEEVFCRCYLVYLYNLSALPESMLTAKGRARLAEARKKL